MVNYVCMLCGTVTSAEPNAQITCAKCGSVMLNPSKLDSPHFTDLTRMVLAKRDAIIEAVFARNGVMEDPTEVAFTSYVDEKVIPVASLYRRWIEVQEAGNVTVIPEYMLGSTLHVLADMLYDNSMHAQNLLEQQPKLN
jgi:hypothetical protein